MQALIDLIVRNFLLLWPVARVYSWQQGVRIRGGHLREELGPGLHWRVPFLDEVYKTNVTEQTVDLATGAITTSDGRSVALSANVAYRITSIRQMWSAVSDVDRSIKNLALGFLAAECTQREWRALNGDRRALQEGLAAYMTTQLRDWGVEITRVNLTDLVEARQWRVFSDSATAFR